MTNDAGFVQEDDAALVEELSELTTQTARMRARMADIMAELERRRCTRGTRGPARHQPSSGARARTP
ncbi:hypothetical protein [Actinomadura flavalba]|uniref:hypothetical protein n=1 Tax=Actinomadura flavalba TaxID=1120938 RepID=UPI0003801330|nr:hypothetical protein [Actinomadura flavalba]